MLGGPCCDSLLLLEYCESDVEKKTLLMLLLLSGEKMTQLLCSILEPLLLLLLCGIEISAVAAAVLYRNL
jgi:hypothetical protein